MKGLQQTRWVEASYFLLHLLCTGFMSHLLPFRDFFNRYIIWTFKRKYEISGFGFFWIHFMLVSFMLDALEWYSTFLASTVLPPLSVTISSFEVINSSQFIKNEVIVDFVRAFDNDFNFLSRDSRHYIVYAAGNISRKGWKQRRYSLAGSGLYRTWAFYFLDGDPWSLQKLQP